MKRKCKICSKSESILSFSYENIITEVANMRQVKVRTPRWTFSFIRAVVFNLFQEGTHFATQCNLSTPFSKISSQAHAMQLFAQ